MAFSWTCPYCNRPTTINGGDYSDFTATLYNKSKEGYRTLAGRHIVCPNQECNRFTLVVNLLSASNIHGSITPEKVIKSWNLIPSSNAKVFPDYIPAPVTKDYQEACEIKDLSAKASATLARRCLQGMIRNYWGIKRKTLKKEIDAIRRKVDPLTWQAIEAVRKVGNIGAHMEKDINLIIDVDPGEALKLIRLIEILVQDWYVSRYEREKDLEAITQIAEGKAILKKQKQAVIDEVRL